MDPDIERELRGECAAIACDAVGDPDTLLCPEHAHLEEPEDDLKDEWLKRPRQYYWLPRK